LKRACPDAERGGKTEQLAAVHGPAGCGKVALQAAEIIVRFGVKVVVRRAE
jgi:hypothetical protein